MASPPFSYSVGLVGSNNRHFDGGSYDISCIYADGIVVYHYGEWGEHMPHDEPAASDGSHRLDIHSACTGSGR